MPATSKAARLKASGKAYRCKSVKTLSVSLWMSFGQRCLTSPMMVSTCMHKKQSKHVCLGCPCSLQLSGLVHPMCIAILFGKLQSWKCPSTTNFSCAGRHCCCLEQALPTSAVRRLQAMWQLFRQACSACWKPEAGHDTGGRTMHPLIASLSGRCYPRQSQEQHYLLLNTYRNKGALD